MEPGMEAKASTNSHFCPKCGAQEEGFFCRNCGALLRGEDMVLCPRCRQIVPQGEFCNQCGQELGGIAPTLQQLALAGDAFWVTEETAASSSSPEPDLLAPDQAIDLAEGHIPDWLHELAAEPAPAKVEARVYPALQPLEEATAGTRQMRFLVVAILLMGALFLGLLAAVAIILLRAGGYPFP